MNALEELYEVVMSRKAMYENGEVDVESQKSYTCYLFSKGQDKILKNAEKSALKLLLPQRIMTMKNLKMKSQI